MASIRLAMQYFPMQKSRYSTLIRSKNSELLFYLVTSLFAQWLCHSRQPSFALQFQIVERTRESRY